MVKQFILLPALYATLAISSMSLVATLFSPIANASCNATGYSNANCGAACTGTCQNGSDYTKSTCTLVGAGCPCK